MAQGFGDLILKLAAPDGLAARAVAQRVACLEHEALEWQDRGEGGGGGGLQGSGRAVAQPAACLEHATLEWEKGGGGRVARASGAAGSVWGAGCV